MRGVCRLLLLGAAFGFAGSLNGLPAQKVAEKAPATIVLKGAKIGGVKFNHAVHEKQTKCVTCHHESMGAKPLASQHQQCGDCHSAQAVAPMKTTIRDAFHDGLAKKGTCVECHTKAVAAGKTAPAKCVNCHKKENV